MRESWDMSDATRTPPVRGPRELRNFTTAKCTVPMGVGCEFKFSLPGGVRTSLPDGSLPCGNHGTCQMSYTSCQEFEISMYSSYPGGVRTSRLCQMVAFHEGIMGHVRRNSYTSCTRPQGASKFQTAKCTVPMGVGCEFKFSYFPGVYEQAVCARW